MFCYKLVLVEDKHFMYIYDGEKVIGIIPLDKNQSTSVNKAKEYEERFGWKKCV